MRIGMLVSLYNGTTPEPISEISISEALQRIKSGNSKDLITKIRAILDKDRRNELKRKLPAVTFAGTFHHRAKDKLKQHNGFITMDFDDIANPSEFRNHIFTDPRVYAAWISPSGKGVKALIRIPVVTSDKQYKEYYNAALEQYDADESTKDISRLTYESYDPDLKIKDFDKVSIFEDKIIEPTKKKATSDTTGEFYSLSDESVFNRLVNGLTTNRVYFIVKNRNNFIFKLAADCNNYGIKKQATLELILERYDLPEAELISTITSAYNSTANHNTKELKVYDEFKPILKRAKKHFPVEVFPALIQNHLAEQKQISNFNIELMSSTLIWLVSTLIGNRCSTFVQDGWNVSPVMWLMIIADRGSTKTHAINAITKPIKSIEKKYREQYEDEIKRYNPESKQPKPEWKQIFLEDGTREGFVKAMRVNPGGLGLLKDELHGWVADMDRHTGGKGGDESFWLSSFNNSSYTKNIKSDETAYADRVFISLMGSIQPQVVRSISDGHTTNGLFDRFLFVPYIEEYKEFKLYLKPPEHLSTYVAYLTYMHRTLNDMMRDVGKQTFYFDDDGGVIYEKHYNYFLKNKFKEKNGISAYIAKIITYFPRICLIMSIIDQCSKTTTIINKITAQNVEDSFKVMDYYLNNAYNVLFEVNQSKEIDEIFKSDRAIKSSQKVRSILNAVANKEISMSNTEIADFVGVSKQYVGKLHKKMLENSKKVNQSNPKRG